MLQWMKANLSTILISVALVVIVAMIIWHLVRQKKQGKSSCGCNCAHCALSGSCHSAPNSKP